MVVLQCGCVVDLLAAPRPPHTSCATPQSKAELAGMHHAAVIAAASGNIVAANVLDDAQQVCCTPGVDGWSRTAAANANAINLPACYHHLVVVRGGLVLSASLKGSLKCMTRICQLAY